MTTPAGLTYTQIETRVLNQIRIPVTNVTEQAKVAALINEVYRDIYVKEDWWWLVKRYGEGLPLKIVGMAELARYKILDQTEGKPEIVTVFDNATTGDPTTARQLQVHPYPDKTYRLEVFYKQQLNTELSGTTQAF